MQIFDLAIAYKWKYDREFVELIECIFQRNGLSTFVIGKFNLAEVFQNISGRKIFFKSYLDRASDEDPDFLPLADLLASKKCYIINPHNKIEKSIDKALVHKKLVEKKFQLPKTILLPPYIEKNHISITEKEIEKICKPFIIKPATISGGGEDVIKNAVSFQQIHEERIKNPFDKYMIQEKIQPRTLQGRRAWFRVIWAFGHVIPTWWDDNTHIYNTVTKNEIKKYNLLPLTRISSKLYKITLLDYFSTEIALTKDHRFVLIDYINDQCDMRLKSNHVDGIPDEVVEEFIERMRKKVSAS